MELSVITAWLSANADNPLLWAVVCLTVYGVLPHVVASTKTLADDKALGAFTRILNLVVGNYGAARNGAALAGRVMGQPTPPDNRTTGRTLGSIAFALLLAGSILLPGCASITGGATPENALADARSTLALVKQVADVYPTLPDHDEKVAAAMTAAAHTLESAITQAQGALDRGEDWRMPVLQAVIVTASTEAWKWVYTYRVAITEPVPAASSTADAR